MSKRQHLQIVKSKAKVSASSQRKAPSKPVVKPQKARTIPFMLLGIFFIVLHLYLNFSPEVKRGWGLNYLQFFELPVILGFYAILIAVLIPPVNDFIVKLFEKISRTKIVAVAGKYRYLLFVLVAIGAGFAFRELEVKYIFLGDAGVRPTQIENGEIINTEYLTMWVLIKLHGWLHTAWDYTGLQTVKLVAYVGGGIFVFISLLLADVAGKTFLKKSAIFVIAALSVASLLLFCGYSEIYVLPLLWMLLCLYTSILYLQGKAKLWLPIVVALVSVAFHAMLVAMLPAIFFLWGRRLWFKYPVLRKKTALVIMAIIALPVIYYIMKHIPPDIMLPMKGKNLLTMFSVAHIKEFLNSQLLGAGFLFLIWVAVLLYILFNRKRLTATHWYLLITSICITGLMFVFNGVRGSGDWDIFSFSAIAGNLMVVIIILDCLPTGTTTAEKQAIKLIGNIKYGICLMAVFGMMHSSFWIITNHTDKSIGWVEKAFATDPANYYRKSFSNESMLGAVFSSNNLKEKSLEWEKKAYLKHQNDPRTGFNYANVLIREGQIEEATKIYEASVVKFPAYALPYAQLVNIYLKDKKYEALYKLLTQMEAAYKQNPQSFTSRLSKEQLDSYWNVLGQLRGQIK